MGEILDLQTALKIERENRKKQKESRYSDVEIKQEIGYARSQSAFRNALTALAMIAYNRMIDERWK